MAEEYILQKWVIFLETLKINSFSYTTFFLTQSGNINTSKTHVTDLTKLDDLWISQALEEEETVDKGISFIIDMKGYSLKMLKFATPGNVKVIGGIADLLPIKHADYHIVNSSKLMSTAVSMIFPFLGQRTKNSTHFHYSDWASLHKHIGSEALPPEYGGTEEINYARIYENSTKLFEQKQRMVKQFVEPNKSIHER